MNESLLAVHPLWALKALLSSWHFYLVEGAKGEDVGPTTQSSTCWGLSQDRRVWCFSPNTLTGQNYKLKLFYVFLCVFLQLLVTVMYCFIIWFLSNTVLLTTCPFSSDGEVTERRAAESVRAAGITRKEVQWSWSCVRLCTLARWHHVEVSYTNLFLFIH